MNDIGRMDRPVGEMPLIAREMFVPPSYWGSERDYGILGHAILTEDGRGAVSIYLRPVRHATFLVPEQARIAGQKLIELADAAEAAEQQHRKETA